MRRGVLWACAIGMGLPIAALARQESAVPLSVIDWLDAPQPMAQLPQAPIQTSPRAVEPDVAMTGTAPQVTTRPLDAASTPARVGLVPPSVTGMRTDLWAASDPIEAIALIDALPDLELPAANALLFTLLLAEASPTPGTETAFEGLTRARVEKLMTLGAVDPALALAEQAGAPGSPVLFDLWADLGLLTGTEDTACGALSRAPRLTRDIGLRIFCDARSGAWADAALAFGSADALSLLPRETLDVLDRFLNPDLFEGEAPLPVPRRMDPLTFRLFETIGEPLPTRPLPRAYAVADLRDIAGWKSQIEAAERLTRAGALPDNRLLGLYTERKPAASGGIWDRVKLVQQLDTALQTGSPEAVAKTLDPAWQAMRETQLEISFAAAFHDRLADIALTGKAARTRARIGLLSPDYETAANAYADLAIDGDMRLAIAVARGTVPATAPKEARARAIHDAFSDAEPDPELIRMAEDRRLGEALLRTLAVLRDGVRGDSGALRRALATLRALGLEDTARRASLQVLLAGATT